MCARRRVATLARVIAAAALASGLPACTDAWLGGGETDAPLPGERISVLLLQSTLEPDPELLSEPVVLPRPIVNPSWPVPGGTPEHALHHLAIGETLAVAWRRDVGSGETDDNLILSEPVVAAGHAYVLDSGSTVTALDLATGRVSWERDLMPDYEEDEASLGGGVSYGYGRLFATTAFGDVVALDAASGDILWSRTIGTPLRAAPAVADGRLFVVTIDNRLFALDARDGTSLWDHAGITESAGLLGAAVPAVSGELVIASYSSGEVFALRVENGRQAWSDSLIFQGRFGARTNLSDVDASPVVDRGLVIAVSQSGRLVAIDLRSGLRVWDKEIPSAQTPWVAGDYIYLVTLDSQLVCLRRADGRIRWVTGLPAYQDPEERTGTILWTGPVLAGDRLIVVGSHGSALAVSPYTGEVLGREELPAGVRVSPVVADQTLYLLTRDAELVAMR
ncbi:MAG TPA: PQQ-binding-like beta-propeller repeat protein [Kiloniellales bacterium]